MSDAIAARIAAVQSQLTAAHNELRSLAELVDMFDADILDATTEESVREVIDSLADASRALAGADDPLQAAVHHAHLLP